MKFSTPLALLAVAAVDAAVVQEDKRWCNTEGQACNTVARAAEAFTNAIKASGVVARDDSAAAQVAARQVDQLALAISASQADPITFYTALGLGDQFTLEEKPHAEKREAAPQWCLRFVGQSCWKRNAAPEAACNAPDGACTKATRDIHAMYNAARHIIDASA